MNTTYIIHTVTVTIKSVFSFFRRFWRYGNYQKSIKKPSRDQEAISEFPQTSVSKRGEVRGPWYENDFLFFCK